MTGCEIIFSRSCLSTNKDISTLTHRSRVTHITNQHWFRYWLGACSAPSHYLNQCCNIVNKTLRNIFQWKFLVKEMHLKTSSAKWRPFLSRPQCVTSNRTSCAETPPYVISWRWQNDGPLIIYLLQPSWHAVVNILAALCWQVAFNTHILKLA